MTPAPASLFGNDFQQVLDAAKANAGTPAGLFPSPLDWRDLPIYFLMVDRFAGTNPINHPPFDDHDFSGFQGGQFVAIQQQLPYIKALGFGAIWLSPVLKNYPWDTNTYHGYGIHDFIHAEPRFSTQPPAANQPPTAAQLANADAELRALVDAAHALGLYIIFDIVLNHIGNGFAYTGQGDEANFSNNVLPIQWRDSNGQAVPADTAVENIPNPDGNAVVWPKELQQNAGFRRQGKTAGDSTIGDFDSLKQMVTESTTVAGYLIRAYQYVIARFDVDAFRIDTLRYLQGSSACTFGNATREFALSIGKKNFFTFGEVDDGNAEADIARFIGRNTQNGAGDLVGVDGALDYPLFFNLKPMIKGQTPPSSLAGMYQNRKNVENDILSSHGDATRFFVTFLDNHDVDDRIRFWLPASQAQIDAQVVAGHACLFALQGIPCLYYGTEQGLHGTGSDTAVREALWGGPGFNQQNPFYQAIQQINAVRAATPALRYGRQYFRPLSGDATNFAVSTSTPGVVAFSRILNDAEVVVVYNSFHGPIPLLDVIVDGTLNPAGSVFRILYSNNPHPVAPQPVRVLNQVNVAEVDGTTGTGPVSVLPVQLGPTEVQIFAR